MNSLRHALILVLLTMVPSPLVTGASPREDAVHRLIGKWQSDREQTLAHWNHLPTASPETRAKIESWFGQFTYTFTRARVKAEYAGGSWEAPYRVLRVVGDQVTIELRHSEKPEQLLIQFSGPYFFIPVGSGGNAEYFRRVSAA